MRGFSFWGVCAFCRVEPAAVCDDVSSRSSQRLRVCAATGLGRCDARRARGFTGIRPKSDAGVASGAGLLAGFGGDKQKGLEEARRTVALFQAHLRRQLWFTDVAEKRLGRVAEALAAAG